MGVGSLLDQVVSGDCQSYGSGSAEILLYPTAIGSEPILSTDSMPHWRRCMQGHSASNLVPVIAANRVGEERVEPCAEMQARVLPWYSTDHLLSQTAVARYRYPWEDRKKVLSQLPLTWTS